jgi:MoaA/NifB/PqqE/SkfB family radical SAM enzyme
MITNGLLLNRVPQETLDSLKWLRVSMSFLDASNYYGNSANVTKRNPLSEISIPKIKGTLGLSYVWTPSSDKTKLDRIKEFASNSNASFVRIVPNCQSPEEQAKYKEMITPLMEEFPKFFFQSKSYDIHFACRVGYLKPFLNSDGNLYHCSASPLYTGKFSEEWKIGSMEDVKKLWPSNLPKMDTSNCYAGKCFYADQNRMLHSLELEVPHDRFI